LTRRRLAVQALVETHCYDEASAAIAYMRDAPAGDQRHKRKCDDFRRINELNRSRLLPKE
jgi:hypothetical protein